MASYFEAMGSALYTVLTGGTALITELGGTAIYQDQAPDGAALPYTVFQHFTGGPDNFPRGMRDNLWAVRNYANTVAKATAVDGEVDTLLDGNNFSLTGFTLFWSVRERDLPSLVETPPDGEKIYMRGGIYRLRTSY